MRNACVGCPQADRLRVFRQRHRKAAILRTVGTTRGQPMAVPNLVGLTVREARDRGHNAAVVVVSADIDGPPLGELTWPGVWVVIAQDPSPGVLSPKWDSVRVTCRSADGNEAGDREPRLPSPNLDGLQAQATAEKLQSAGRRHRARPPGR